MKPNVYHTRLWLLAFLPFLLSAGWGCAKEKATVPSWIEIDTMGFVAQPGEGTGSQRFTDAWVYANSNLVGCFELPARVPVLAEGSANIIIFPGVQLNGLTALRTPYLKAVRYNQNLDLVPGQTITVNPVYTYDSLLTFVYMENFENSGFSMDKSDGAYGEFEIKSDAPDVAFEGDGCGIIRHNGAENTLTQVETNAWFALPKGDVGGIYMEFNYKCNTSFTVSLLCKPNDGANSKLGIIGLNPTYGEWKKIYVALSPTVNDFTAGNQFKPVIGYVRQPDIDVQEVYIDNIRILY